MRSNFESPDRCQLAQVAHWFVNRIEPIPCDIYEAAPREFDLTMADQRELYIELRKADFDLRGSLVWGDIRQSEEEQFRLGRRSINEIEFDYSGVLQRDFPFDLGKFELREIDFETSTIYADRGLHFETLASDGQWRRERARIQELDRKEDIFEGVARELVRFIWHVTVDFSKFRAALEGLAPGSNQKSPAPKGRPSRYRWDAIWAEIAVQADLDGLPDSQAECIRWIQEWYQRRFNEEPPSDPTLKERLRLIYKHPRKSKADG